MCTEDNEIKKAYLLRYLESKKRENELLLEMEELEGRYILPSKVIDDMPHGSAGDDDLSSFAAQYDQLYYKIKRQFRRSMTIYDETVNIIESIPTGETIKTVLRYRYILGMKWEEIAVAMNYSFRRVTQLHGEALSRLKLPKRLNR